MNGNKDYRVTTSRTNMTPDQTQISEISFQRTYFSHCYGLMTALVNTFKKKQWFDGKENSSVTQYAAVYITNIIISDDHVEVTGIFSHLKSAGSSVFI